jgi:pimeloyl-ACP methyl ester carboxylesterase
MGSLNFIGATGFRVITPDQRGYNRTGKTPPYDLDTFARDVAQLQDARGIQHSHIVVRDWSGVVAYALAHRYPERVHKLVVMKASRINAYFNSVWAENWRQGLKSWFVYAFQLPRLPEQLFARDNFAVTDRAFVEAKHMTRSRHRSLQRDVSPARLADSDDRLVSRAGAVSSAAALHTPNIFCISCRLH